MPLKTGLAKDNQASGVGLNQDDNAMRNALRDDAHESLHSTSSKY